MKTQMIITVFLLMITLGDVEASAGWLYGLGSEKETKIINHQSESIMTTASVSAIRRRRVIISDSPSQPAIETASVIILRRRREDTITDQLQKQESTGRQLNNSEQLKHQEQQKDQQNPQK
jgi:hypothetical protein